jgi:hypothetical protein
MPEYAVLEKINLGDSSKVVQLKSEADGCAYICNLLTKKWQKLCDVVAPDEMPRDIKRTGGGYAGVNGGVMPQEIENINKALSELCGLAGRMGLDIEKICVDSKGEHPGYGVSLEFTTDRDALRGYIEGGLRGAK